MDAYKPITTIWPLLSIRCIQQYAIQSNFFYYLIYIQLDTLSHIIFDHAVPLGFHQQFIPVLEALFKFHDNSAGVPESIIQAYHWHSYFSNSNP